MALDKHTEKILKAMKHPTLIRNIGIVAHIDHGKSTFSDNIIAGAGMLSKELAGDVRVTDDMQEEQERGITIQTAAVSMVHDYKGDEILVNLLDTPGHVDFGGDVTRAMRAVDGAIVLACAVEGVMPQTETVLKQALNERVKPVLFINKVDRLIREVKLTPEAMQEKFVKIITNVNKLIKDLAPKEYKETWQVNVQSGSVAFGSAYHNWALSVPLMQQKGISFKDIIDAYASGNEDDWKALADRAPLSEVALDMVTKHCPSPADSQKYRIPHLWKGDMDSEDGRRMIACDSSGQLIFIVTKMKVDPQAGEVAFGRVFAGKLEKGKEVYLNGAKLKGRIQQTMLFKGGGTNRIVVPEVPAGNVAAVVGLRAATSGETVSEEPIDTFEGIKHIFDPVVTKAIEAKNPQDLAKLIVALRQLAKEDPTIKVAINEETGENLISGLGELHLEIKEHILQRDIGLNIVVSPPIVVYREAVEKPSPQVMGKSPNKHNKLFVVVEPLNPEVAKAIKRGDIPAGKIKKIKDHVLTAMTENGVSRDEAKRTWDVYNGNMLVDETRGIVHIGEIQELVVQSFEEAVDSSPLSREPAVGLKIRLMDAKLHEDSIHRGPAQIIPCMREAIFNSMLTAGVILMEPKQTIRIDCPVTFLGAASKLINSRRGQLLETEQSGEQLVIVAKIPVSEMFGFTSSLRSATTGRGVWFLVDQVFERIPRELQDETVLRIRKRKGLKEEIPRPINYSE
jgi:elongation factor 2